MVHNSVCQQHKQKTDRQTDRLRHSETPQESGTGGVRHPPGMETGTQPQQQTARPSQAMRSNGEPRRSRYLTGNSDKVTLDPMEFLQQHGMR